MSGTGSVFTSRPGSGWCCSGAWCFGWRERGSSPSHWRAVEAVAGVFCGFVMASTLRGGHPGLTRPRDL